MATSTSITERAERDLQSLCAFINDMPGLDEEWDSLDEFYRDTLSREWDHLMMSLLTELDEYARSGHLSTGQSARYEVLKHKLKKLLSLIIKLNWYRPPVSLEPTA